MFHLIPHPYALQAFFWGICLGWGALAMRGAAQTQQVWGGKQFDERVPYQPEALLERWATDAEPLDLEKWLRDENIHVAGLTTDTTAIATDLNEQAGSQLPAGTRDGVFQKLTLTGTYLPQFDGDSVGWGDLEASILLGFPFLRRETPLLITPRYAVHYLDRPPSLDLPDKVFDASIEFRHLRKFGAGPWAMDVAVTVGHYSDYESDDADALRVTGRGLAVYEAVPGVKWVAGVAYLNRAGATVLPVGGLIYDPTPEVSYELIFPRPRVWWLLPGSCKPMGDERWFYVGGEFGGGVWSIHRQAADVQDLMTYRDFRIVAGYQRKLIGGISRTFEFGYVFGRELEFEETAPDVSLDDTLMARLTLVY